MHLCSDGLVAIDRDEGPMYAVDAVLRNQKLERLHHWLSANVTEYHGLYEAGSLAAGDPWVWGRSDRDVAIVVRREIAGQTKRVIRRQLAAPAFNDTYLFHLVPRDRFLVTHNDQDISMKFRGEVLFGEDLISLKETPSRAFADEIARSGLRKMRRQLDICALNAECWSVELLRDKLYASLKLVLMYLADRAYADSGRYPRRRVDVARAFGSTDLLRVARLLWRIDDAQTPLLLSVTRTAREALSVSPPKTRIARPRRTVEPRHSSP
jgi:hypothetical protein